MSQLVTRLLEAGLECVPCGFPWAGRVFVGGVGSQMICLGQQIHSTDICTNWLREGLSHVSPPPLIWHATLEGWYSCPCIKNEGIEASTGFEHLCGGQVPDHGAPLQVHPTSLPLGFSPKALNLGSLQPWGMALLFASLSTGFLRKVLTWGEEFQTGNC